MAALGYDTTPAYANWIHVDDTSVIPARSILYSGSQARLVVLEMQAMVKANEDDDWSGVDKLMGALFGLKDEDICFYFDVSNIIDKGTSRLTKLVPELQKDFDIVIKDIWVERTSNE